MTTLVALTLVAVALVAILYPLVVQSPRMRQRSGHALLDLEEEYRSALADLQDLQTDWEAGTIGEGDHEILRDRYRRRAAEALRDLAQREDRVSRVLVEVEQEVGALSDRPGSPDGSFVVGAASFARDRAGAPHANRATRSAQRESRTPAASIGQRWPWAASAPVLAAGLAAVVAVAGIALLYARQVGSQASQAPIATLQLDHAHAVAFDRTGEIWLGHHDGLVRSTDGRTWSATGVNSDVMAILLMTSVGQFAFGHDLILSMGPDGGWRAVAHDLPGTDIHGADVGPSGILAYVVDHGLFRSADGERWERTAPPVPQGVSGLAVLPAPGGHTVFLGAGGTVIRSPDDGHTWSPAAGAAGGALTGTIRTVAADAVSGSLYAASSAGLFRSYNLGTDWTKLPYRGSVAAVGVRGQRVVVVDDEGRVFASTDGGVTWPGP